MASKITSVRSAPREVRGASSGKDFIVELIPGGVIIREKGRRGSFGPVSYDAIYSLAAKQEAAAAAAEKTPRRRGTHRNLLRG